MVIRAWATTFIFILSMGFASVGNASSCSAKIINEETITRLQELGFTRSVAERIESKSGLSREIFDAERDGTFSGVIVDSREEVLKDRADYPATYRGLHRLKPQDYKSNFDSTSFRGKVYFGDLTIATEFAKPLSDRNGIEHMILEFQVPWTVTSTAPFGDFPIFRRRQNLDERTFISRVGFYTFIPDDLTSREYFSVRPDGWRQKSELTWYDYDEVFDARGQVRKRFKPFAQ